MKKLFGRLAADDEKIRSIVSAAAKSAEAQSVEGTLALKLKTIGVQSVCGCHLTYSRVM
jgi:hypothetical protein